MNIRKVFAEDTEQLKVIAKQTLEPLYGCQKKAINEWLTGNGYKHAFVYMQNGAIAGLLLMKANPEKSFLKVSTLVVIEGFRGTKIGKNLLKYAINFAKEKKYEDIIVTVSESKPKAVIFFQNFGFKIVKYCPNKYINGVTELIMLVEVE